MVENERPQWDTGGGMCSWKIDQYLGEFLWIAHGGLELSVCVEFIGRLGIERVQEGEAGPIWIQGNCRVRKVKLRLEICLQLLRPFSRETGCIVARFLFDCLSLPAQRPDPGGSQHDQWKQDQQPLPEKRLADPPRWLVLLSSSHAVGRM